MTVKCREAGLLQQDAEEEQQGEPPLMSSKFTQFGSQIINVVQTVSASLQEMGFTLFKESFSGR